MTKSIFNSYVVLFTIFITFSSSAITVNLSGSVRNINNTPVENAEVRISNITAITDINGKFVLLGQTAGITMPQKSIRKQIITLSRDEIHINLTKPSPVSVTMYTNIGKKVFHYSTEILSSGVHSISLPMRHIGTGYYLMSVQCNGDQHTFTYLTPFSNRRNSDVISSTGMQADLPKSVAISQIIYDTLHISAEGYQSVKYPIQSYTLSNINITLDRISHAPEIPGKVTLIPGEAKITIKWDKVHGATSYNIYWSNQPNVTKQSNKISTSSPSHIHRYLINGTTYYYRVSAVKIGAESSLSTEVHAATDTICIAWMRYKNRPLSPNEILHWNGSTVNILMDDDIYDISPLKISGNNIVWHSKNKENYDIYWWNGTTVKNLSGLTGYNDRNEYPQISGDNIVWRVKSKKGTSIAYWNGSMVKQLKVDSFGVQYPQISGDNVVWAGSDRSDYEIFFWNGSTIKKVTDNNYNDEYPQISGNNIVWIVRTENGYNISYWNGSLIKTLAESNYKIRYPNISGNNIVWAASDGNDYEIFFWNGSTVKQLTDNNTDDEYPQISGDNVVWAGSDDGKDHEIFYWDGSTTIKLTDNNTWDSQPQISGNHVVWRGSDGDDIEIYYWNGLWLRQLSNDTEDWLDIGPAISAK